jgi:aryl-alcohol dehydrogenase-like predicted oxidoreductase
VEQVVENVAAIDVKLDETVLARVDEALGDGPAAE